MRGIRFGIAGVWCGKGRGGLRRVRARSGTDGKGWDMDRIGVALQVEAGLARTGWDMEIVRRKNRTIYIQTERTNKMEKPELRDSHCAWLRGGKNRIINLQLELGMLSLVSGYSNHISGPVLLNSEDAEACKTNEALQELYNERWGEHIKDDTDV